MHTFKFVLTALIALPAATPLPALAQSGGIRAGYTMYDAASLTGAKKKGARNVAGATVIPAGAGAVLSYYRGKSGPSLQRTKIVCDQDGQVNIGPTQPSRIGEPSITQMGNTVVLVGGGGRSCPGGNKGRP